MLRLVFILAIAGASSALNLISRDGWGARPPTSTTRMSVPVPYVVIHHSAGATCTTQQRCISEMQAIQNLHQNTNGWADIGYSFTVGGDGNAYTGRGWTNVGAHAPGYNSNSIGICLLGNWMESLPPANQLQAVHELIQYGVNLGMIRADYTLVGHRQVTATLCPGDKMYEEIRTWDHFVDIY